MNGHGGPDQHKVFGLMIGVVTNNVDDKGNYCVKVRFPVLPNGGEQDGEESHRCQVATVMAGNERGAHWMPEVNDVVVVAFEHGEISSPIILGSLWNQDKPIFSNKDASGKIKDAAFTGKVEAKKNDLRAFRSRVGHQLIFNDNKDEPRVALHSNQKHRIVLDDKGNEPAKIEIYDGKEENYILIDTKNKKIVIETTSGSMELLAKENFKIKAKTIEMESTDGDITVKSKKNFTMKAGSNMELKASGTGKVESSDALTVKGSKVNIN